MSDLGFNSSIHTYLRNIAGARCARIICSPKIAADLSRRLAGRPSEGQRDKAYIGDALVSFIFRKGRWVRA